LDGVCFLEGGSPGDYGDQRMSNLICAAKSLRGKK
jgi:hypothetical protein